MIDPHRLKILSNYVLVKPDKDFETYQFAGRETGILAASYKYDEKGHMVSAEQEHISICGEVYAVPNQLIYNGHKIWKIQDNSDFRRGAFVRSREIQKEIDYLRENSVQFDVPMEVKVGDKVFFEYLSHMLADQQGRWIDTTEGRMMMIKYDMLIMAVRNGENKMLNGCILIENEEVKKDKVLLADGGNSWEVEGTVRESGLVLVGGKVEKRTRSNAIGIVKSVSPPCNSYLDFRGMTDRGVATIEVGDRILYDPRFAKELEYGLHRIFSDKKLVRIQRKDVYFVLGETELNISYL